MTEKPTQDVGPLAQEKIRIRRLDADGNILEEQELIAYQHPSFASNHTTDEEHETNDC